MRIFERAGQWLARICTTLSALCLVSLMGLTVVEVVGRYGFNAPVFGRQDLAQLLLALSLFFAFPVTTLRGEQIAVDLLDGLFSSRIAFWRDRIIDLFVATCLLVVGYWLWLRAEKFQERGIVSELLFLPKYPLVYFVAASVILSGLALIGWALIQTFKGRQS